MTKPLLVIGNRNYSSWSLRAWLCLRRAGVEFDEELLPLDTPEFAARVGALSPSGRVPALWHDNQCVWDSLAICEYVNEVFAAGALWPQDVRARGHGRALVAEMHSGFRALRDELPMNCRASDRQVPLSGALRDDIQRVQHLWDQCRLSYGARGDWLLGDYSIADAFFAPVVSRFATYGIAPATPQVHDYCARVRADVHLGAWYELARQESWVVAADEAGEQT